MSPVSRELHPSNGRPSAIPIGDGVADVGPYRILHQVLRRSNDLLVGAVVDLRRLARHESAPALQRWFEAYAAELREHHWAEQTIYFPALSRRIPSFAECAPRLDLDHRRIDDVVDVASLSLARVADASPTWNDDQAAAVAQVVELRDLVEVHQDDVERDVLPLFERHFSATEFAALNQRARAGVGLSRAGFHLPWLAETGGPSVAPILAAMPPSRRLVRRLRSRSYRRLVRRAFGPVPTPSLDAARFAD
jgi:hypothetical protein